MINNNDDDLAKKIIDTVKKEFYPEMLARIKTVLDPQQIEIIISNHMISHMMII